jgi:hypothetical protein
MKQLDYTKPLSDEDKQWLRSIGLGNRVDANEKEFGVRSEEDIQTVPTVDDDYDEWKISELKAEADSRDPKVEYTSNIRKEQLIEALRAWDREHPDAD